MSRSILCENLNLGVIVKLFEACKNGRNATQMHTLVIKMGLTRDTFSAAKLMGLYAKFTPIQSARKLFDETSYRTIYIWNAILKSYCNHRRYGETLSLFATLLSCESPDCFTIPIALKACAGLKVFDLGTTIHAFAKKNGQLGSNLFVGSGLVELYSICKRMDDALRVFEEFPAPDVVLWTTMVTGYEQNGDADKALDFFARTVREYGIVPDPIMLVSVVSACAQLSNLMAGRSVHGIAVRMGFDNALSLSNSLLNLYAKTGCLGAAENFFRKMEIKDVISWGSMITCYAHNGAAKEALDLFTEMVATGVAPNVVAVIGALQACEATCNLEVGKRIHQISLQNGIELDILVSTALIDMYMNCSSPREAIEVFKMIPDKDPVCWSALLSGCVRNGLACESIEAFRDMLASDNHPDAITMVNILTACSELGILQQTCCVHGFVIRSGFNFNSFVEASLIESYTKCGSLDDAFTVFKGIKYNDVVTWSSMFAAYGFHGKGKESLELFQQMVRNSAVRPNNVTFLSILSACSHAGLVKEGLEIFNIMVSDYQLRPDSKHYGIVVDLLGRTGELDKAMEFINQMPEPVGADVWGALLGACRIHQNVEMGEVAGKKLLQLDPDHTGYYILLSNIYATDGKWDDADAVRTLAKDKKLKKITGQSIIELRDEVHTFIANDRCHPDSEQIHELLLKLEGRLRDCYAPSIDFLLQDACGT